MSDRVDVRNIDSPTFRNPAGKPITHRVILKVVSPNICGSDQHMVRGPIHVSNRGRITIFTGGVQLQRDGSIIGAVGVSDGSGSQDDAVATAGAAAFAT
jgi:Haem-degrading